MNPENYMAAVYDSHDEAEKAVKTLNHNGYDLKKLSIVGKDYHTDENVVGYYNQSDRMLKWGGTGAFWGSIWGILVGSAFFIIPGFGPLLIAGPLVSALVGALEGAIIGGSLSALGAALVSLGIPENSVLEYETEIKAGKFMLLVHGSPELIEKAKELLGVGDKTFA